ncbi:MAG: hypothetical protein J0I68_24020 [Achromobacter sp.]|uniref:hypothetical protein n=1 Tax=unclassified Achromobacter TaxID=2626865 RepID=UPI0006C24551|nr:MULTISPECIES: hypothetical protein [unclassified Achromobacter]MBN9641627.1 hypothetical protein [Achromobacter sp.]CUJ79230.1 Uncharacterised protein [Achromobacter sp. 2789STDY5608628]
MPNPQSRLLALAAEAKQQYLAECAAGGEPAYPAWIEDALAVCGGGQYDTAAPGISTAEDAQDMRSRVMEVIAGVWDHATQIDDAADEVIDMLRPAPAAGDALPSKPGVYAWSAGTSNALVLVDRRPSAHSPAGVLNGHVIESTRFYDGCAVESWGRDGRWTLLHDFDAAIAAQRNGGQ